jgi:hypothetical protein
MKFEIMEGKQIVIFYEMEIKEGQFYDISKQLS